MKLNDIVPWGRSLREYHDMFLLTDEDLLKSILGCGDGPASFNAELTSSGGKVISSDPVYRFSEKEIRSRVRQACPIIIELQEYLQIKFLLRIFILLYTYLPAKHYNTEQEK